MLLFRMEHHANLLWIPLASPYNTNQVNFNVIPEHYQHDCHPHHRRQVRRHHQHCHLQAWLDTHFKNKDRVEVAIFKTNNVLTPTALKEVRTMMMMLQS